MDGPCPASRYSNGPCIKELSPPCQSGIFSVPRWFFARGRIVALFDDFVNSVPEELREKRRRGPGPYGFEPLPERPGEKSRGGAGKTLDRRQVLSDLLLGCTMRGPSPLLKEVMSASLSLHDASIIPSVLRLLTLPGKRDGEMAFF
jgi:hypothetical protein